MAQHFQVPYKLLVSLMQHALLPLFAPVLRRSDRLWPSHHTLVCLLISLRIQWQVAIHSLYRRPADERAHY